MLNSSIQFPLPREYTSLADAASRWRVTVDDLLHLGVQDQVQICASTNKAVGANDREPLSVELLLQLEEEDAQAAGDQCQSHRRPKVPFSEWQSRTTVDMPPGVFAIYPDELRCIARAPDRRWDVREVTKFIDGQWHYVALPAAVTLGIDELCILQEEVERIEGMLHSQAPGSRRASAVDRPWPWGEHTTQALELLKAAAFEFWAGFEADKPEEAPTSKEVEAWLVQRGASAGLAEAIARLLRADGLPAGPRPKGGAY